MLKTTKTMFSRALIFLTALALSAVSCKDNKTDKPRANIVHAEGTITAVTLYAPQFLRDIKQGQEHEYHSNLVEKFARDNGLELKLIRTHSVDSIYYYLDNGICQLAAFDIIPEEGYITCGDSIYSSQLILTRKHEGKKNTFDNLQNATVYYLHNKHRARLEELRQETGKDFACKKFDGNTDEAIEALANGKIDYLACNDFTAANYLYNYPNMDLSLIISIPSAMSWCTTDDSLSTAINRWFDKKGKTCTRTQSLYKSLAFTGKNDFRYISIDSCTLSPYDDLFKKYAKRINWDWRMLAALAYSESNFDQQQVSHSGAIGLMQLMPVTAKEYGYKPSDLLMVDLNMEVATLLIKTLQKFFSHIENIDERNNFIIATYNCGIGHMRDVMALAEKYGLDPNSWSNISNMLLFMDEEGYYNDNVCKHGSFNGKESFDLVNRVNTRFFSYRKNFS